MPWHNVLVLLQHLLTAAHFAHQKLIAHMDIKPENVLVAATGEYVLCDWGSAMHVHPSPVVFSRACTPCFSAPEADGSHGPAHPRPCDIWSVGMTAVAVLTAMDLDGRPRGDDPVAFAAERTPGGLPDTVRDLLSHMLARDPRARPTAEQLLEHPALKKGSK